MDTAKVDIRKLQLLSDRINQTIDALHQVRMSVHGLSQTPGVFGVGTGINPFVTPFGNAVTPFGTTPWNQTAFANPYANVQSQLLAQLALQTQLQQLAQQQIAAQQLAQQLAAQAQLGQTFANNTTPFGINTQMGINPQVGINSQVANPFVTNPLAGMNQQASSLSHSAYTQPYNQWAIPNVFGTLGYATQYPGIAQTTGVGLGVNPFAQQGIGGFSHSAYDVIDPLRQSSFAQHFDPTYMSRLQQAFPFAPWGHTPVQGIGV